MRSGKRHEDTFKSILERIENGPVDAVRSLMHPQEWTLDEQVELLARLHAYTIGFLEGITVLKPPRNLRWILARVLGLIPWHDPAAANVKRARALAYSLDVLLSVILDHPFFGSTDGQRALNYVFEGNRDHILIHLSYRGQRYTSRDFSDIGAELEYLRAIAQDRVRADVIERLHSLVGASDTFSVESYSFLQSSRDSERAPTSRVSLAAAKVSFSAFYPRMIEANKRAGLFVYVHLETTLQLIQQDVVRFQNELGGDVPAPKTAKKHVRIRPGTMVTIVPECEELEFNPPALTKRWEPDWVRYEFDFRASGALVGETAIVDVSIQVKGIEIASIKKCAIEVLERKIEEPATKPPLPLMERETALSATQPSENKLAKAKAEFEARMARKAVAPYQKIFVSYSHKDTEVIQAYKASQEALGNDVFVDTESIHTGEDWKAQLAIAIDSADAFQLFWSENSAASEYVREEWKYALLHKCPENKCISFIRPAYWKGEKPIPEPPEELSHLHFRRVDFGTSGFARAQ